MPYSINMGAVAITTLAARLIIAAAGWLLLNELVSFLKDSNCSSGPQVHGGSRYC
jgi:hypothetical protein